MEDMSVPAKMHEKEIREMNDQLYSAYHRIIKLQKELTLLKEMYNEISEDGLNYESLIKY